MFKFLIKNDLFNIVNRLKSIDKKYFIVYNCKKHKYEVHYRRAKNTYELTVPYDKLDARTISLVQKTKIENQRQFLESIERENQILQQKNKNEILENLRRVYEC
ncbi:MAG: hypothetical protein ACI4TZ_04165 [Christensenellales bacterium]